MRGWWCAEWGSKLDIAEWKLACRRKGSLRPRHLDLRPRRTVTGPAPLPTAGGSDVSLRMVVVGPPAIMRALLNMGA